MTNNISNLDYGYVEYKRWAKISERCENTGGGHWPRKGVWGVRPWRLPFHAFPVVHKGPISSNSQFTSPLLENKKEILASSTSIVAQILTHKPPKAKIWKFSVHKPPNLEIFSSQGPFLETMINSHFTKMQDKEVWPGGGTLTYWRISSLSLDLFFTPILDPMIPLFPSVHTQWSFFIQFCKEFYIDII